MQISPGLNFNIALVEAVANVAQDRQIAGTTPWTHYRNALPLDPAARTMVPGALLVGKGTTWADDLQLLVDGRPVAEAPKVARSGLP